MSLPAGVAAVAAAVTSWPEQPDHVTLDPVVVEARKAWKKRRYAMVQVPAQRLLGLDIVWTIAAGHVDLREFDVDEVVSEVTSVVGPVVRAACSELDVSSARGAGTMVADSGKVRQIRQSVR